jgi:hypothetical protein
MFAEILEKDEAVIEELFSDISNREVHITRQTLQALLDELSRGELS